MLDVDAVYRFLDKLNSKLQMQIEQTVVKGSKKKPAFPLVSVVLAG
jgi:hypothetical protein